MTINIMEQESTISQAMRTQTVQTTAPIKFESAPSYREEATDDKDLFRLVDREGDWSHYKLKLGGTEKFLPSVNHILGIGFPKGQGLLNWLKSKTAEESDKILKHAGERGSRTHYAIRDLIQGQVLSAQAYYKNEDGSSTPLKIDEWDYLLSWVAWCEKFKPKLLKHETGVYNKKYGFAGTVDFIGTINLEPGMKVYIDGKLTEIKGTQTQSISCLLDWKTSGAIYDEYKLQTAAYAACMKLKPQQSFFTGVIRLGTKHKDGFEMQLWSRNKTLEHLKQFLITKDTYHFINGTDWKPDIKQIPLVLKVDVPRIQSNGQKPKRDNGRRPNVSGNEKSNEAKPRDVRGGRSKDSHGSPSKSVHTPGVKTN